MKHTPFNFGGKRGDTSVSWKSILHSCQKHCKNLTFLFLDIGQYGEKWAKNIKQKYETHSLLYLKIASSVWETWWFITQMPVNLHTFKIRGTQATRAIIWVQCLFMPSVDLSQLETMPAGLTGFFNIEKNYGKATHQKVWDACCQNQATSAKTSDTYSLQDQLGWKRIEWREPMIPSANYYCQKPYTSFQDKWNSQSSTIRDISVRRLLHHTPFVQNHNILTHFHNRMSRDWCCEKLNFGTAAWYAAYEAKIRTLTYSL
jgi:hypothetical protein